MQQQDVERFWSNASDQPGADCWEWQGIRTVKGYGRFYYYYRNLRAHRVAYELRRGPIPRGLMVLHACDNPPCINPDHLFLGTAWDNANDAVRRKRGTGKRGKGRKKLS